MVFSYFDPEKKYVNFLPTGYVIIVRDKNLNEEQKIADALSLAKWKITKTTLLYKVKSKSGETIQVVDGLAPTDDKKTMYIKIAYFEREIGLVVIPIVSPVAQRLTVQTCIDAIINSIKIFEPQNASQ